MGQNFPQRGPGGKVSLEQSLSHQSPQTLCPAQVTLIRSIDIWPKSGGRRLGPKTGRGVLVTIGQTWGAQKKKGALLLRDSLLGRDHGVSRGNGRAERAGKQLGAKEGPESQVLKVQMGHLLETSRMSGWGDKAIK